MDKSEIEEFIKLNIEYDDWKGQVSNHYFVSSTLAAQLGFSEYIANIINVIFLRFIPTGDKEKDSNVLSDNIQKAIWL